MSLQAVILAGGLGTRLRPLTETVPKPMVPVCGRPYLEHQIELLRRQGICRILLLTGYLGEQIEAHFGAGERHGVRIRYSREPEPLGTGGALRLAAAQLEDAFLVINGDSYLPVDYAPLEAALAQPGMRAALAVYDNRIEDTGVRNNIALDGALVGRYQKGSDDPALTHVDAGVIALRRQELALVERERFSLEQEVFPLLIQARAMAAAQAPHRFYDMGTPRGLAMLEAYLQS